MNKRFAKSIFAYLPAFSFTLTYIIYVYLTTGVAAIVSPLQFFYTIIKIFIILAGFSFIAKKIIKNDAKAGLAVWFTTVLWLFTEKIFIISMIISILLVLTWVGILWIRKIKISLEHIPFLLTLLGIILTVLLLVNLVPWSFYLRQIPEIREMPKPSLTVPKVPPDIYYIVLDGYVRTDVLKELYGFDNSDFVNYLVDNKFIVPENNHSNYVDTIFSVGSTLNMQYIQALMPDAEDLSFKWLMSPVIKDNQVKEILEESGYKSVVVFGDWEFTNIDNADIYLKPLPIQMNRFEKFLFQSSPLKLFSSVVEKFILVRSYPSHRKTVNFAFNALSEIPSFDGPKFVFAHITSPHPPFVFDKDGQPVEPPYNFTLADGNDFPGSREQYKAGYVDQLQYINRQLVNAIDSILEKSDNPPIIIILSDHGSRMLTDFSLSQKICIRERISNFAAFYLPGVDDHVIPSDITPVNVFRLIFDQYFGTDLGMLKNRYFLSDSETVYNFVDVSSHINTGCEISP